MADTANSTPSSNLDGDLATLTAHPWWKTADQNARVDALTQVFQKHGSKATPDEQRQVATQYLKHTGWIGGGEDTHEAAISRPMPGLVRAAEDYVAAPAAMYGGGLAGGAAGLWAGGPAGAYAGARVGEASGLTAADIATAKLNEHFYNTRSNLTPKTVTEDFGVNLGGSLGGERLMHYAGPIIGKAARSLLGMDTVESTLRAATEQSQGVREDFQRSLEREGQTNLARNADAAKAAEAERAGQQKAAETEYAKTAGEQAEKDRAAAVSGSLTRTPEQTRTAISAAPEVTQTTEGPAAIASPEVVARRTRFYDAIYGPKNRAANELGTRFDNLFKPHIDKALNAPEIGQAAAQEEQYASGAGVEYSPKVRNLLAEMKAMSAVGQASGPPTPEMIDAGLKRMFPDSADIANISPAAKLRYYQTGLQQGIIPSPETAPAVTIGQWLGKRSEIGQLMTRAEGPDRAALHLVRESINDALAKSGVPGADQLRATYRSFKTDFAPEFFRKISKLSEPSDAALEIFDHPQRAQQLVSGANSEERGTLRDLYSDYVNRGMRNGKDFEQLLKPEHADFLGKLFPGTPLADPQGIAYVKQKISALGEMPEFRRQYDDAVANAVKINRQRWAGEVEKEALAQAKRLGPVGKQIIAQINEAHRMGGPEAAADTATKALTGLTPEQFLKKLANVKYPTLGAEDMMRRSGEESDQNFNNFMMRTIKNPNVWPYYATLGGIAVASGGGAGYFGKLALAGAAYSGRRGLQQAFVRSLDNPATLQRFLSSAGNLTDGHAISRLANLTVDAMVKNGAAKFGKYETGVTLEAKPGAEPERPPLPPEPKNPATAGEQKKHTVAKVADKVSRADTPDISKELRGGKLAQDDIAKILQGGVA